jgi:hypothetical protein
MEGGLLLFSCCMDLTAKLSSHCWIRMVPSMHHHCGASSFTKLCHLKKVLSSSPLKKRT